MTNKVLDVSSYQTTVDWSAVKASGVSAVYAKATEGVTLNDSTFTSHVQGAQSVGLPVGAYHFAHPESNDPTAEAKHFVSILQQTSTDLMPVLDLESPTSAGHLTGAQIVAWVRTFVSYLEAQTGRKVMLYTGPWYANMFDLSGLGDIPLWVSAYGVSAPSQFAEWTSYLMRQYTDTATVTGISGNVDMSYASSVAALQGNYTEGDLTPMSNPTVQLNSTGAAVETLQKDLNTLGANPALTVDGDFGAGTQTAVKAFQSAHGLTVDGVVGPATWAAIAAALQPKTTPDPSPTYPSEKIQINGVAITDGIAMDNVTYVPIAAFDALKVTYTVSGSTVTANGKQIVGVVYNGAVYVPWPSLGNVTANKITGGFNFTMPTPTPPPVTTTPESTGPSSDDIEQALSLLAQAQKLLEG
ncbi:GH25 family lysozyme [Alicyclobacillus fastidiosus]|uniref:GH25 family lysozyme n=1 Tax=Alicyclobacillus fastidiosus TaxID=392011 RepID=A0ABV5A9W5_9BACL|nr:GH25 family lysozyme [Alicyclobacillus fastidiosus]WEH10976.1 GH25 family lysozyme [Alicyclobacillus fastidiosus]